MEKQFQALLKSLLINHDKRSWLRRHCSGSFSGLFGNIFTAAFFAVMLWMFSSDEAKSSLSNSAKENLVTGIARIIGVEVSLKDFP